MSKRTLDQRYELVIDKIRKHGEFEGDVVALEDAFEFCGDLWAQVPEKNRNSALLQTEETLEELEL